MKKILVCQHVSHEPLGILNPLLKKSGFRIKYINFGRHPDLRPSLKDYHGLVILGGPMNCDEVEKYPNLTHEVSLIQQALEAKKPILGICLGAQLMARALGAKVTCNPQKEIGWYPITLTDEGKKDPLFFHIRDIERVFQWHGDTFEIPQGAIHLASSPLCANQAFRFGTNAYALQFHLEVDEAMIKRWLTISTNREELEFLKDKIDPERIKKETPAYMAPLTRKGEALFREWIKFFGKEKKIRLLRSR